jgi:hypothetical protein
MKKKIILNTDPEYLDTHTEVSNHTHQFPPSVTNQHSLARYVIDNNLITHVPSQGAFIVQGRSGKYCVTLFPKETYQCPSTTTCFHFISEFGNFVITLIYSLQK